MPEDDAVCIGLNMSHNHDIWDKTEAKFWAQFESDQKAWRVDHERHYRDLSTTLQHELRDLTAQRETLKASRTRLLKELASIGIDLRVSSDRCDTKTHDLGALKDESRRELEKKVQDWELQSWSLSPLEKPSSLEKFIANGAASHEADGEPMDGVEKTANGHRHIPSGNTDALVDVVDADGNVIGPVQRIEPWNQWVQAILQLPIQRKVKIRRGRRFDHNHLETIYDRSEAKGVKWLSCMIQATGEVQAKRCTSCDKHQGAFEQCVIVGGDLLQKCGNCEWNRQGCHGASGEQVLIEAAEELERQREDRRRETERSGVMQQRQREQEEAQRREQERQEVEKLEFERQERDRQCREQQYREEQARMEEPRQMQAQHSVERELYKHERVEQVKLERERHMAHGRHEKERQQQEPLARQTTEGTQSDQWRPIRTRTESERQGEQPHPCEHHRQSEPPRDNNPHAKEAMRQYLNPHRKSLPSHLPPPKYVLESTADGPPNPPIPQPALQPAYPTPSGFKPANNGFTPINLNQRITPPTATRAPAPLANQEIPMHIPAASVERSPQARPQFESLNEKPELPLVEITKDNLVLRHNGTVYTYPECMVGVPLVKIHPGHSYWEPEWEDVRTKTVPCKKRWEKKHAAAIEAEARKKRSGSSKYQIGRQVNRGRKILEFLDDDEQISPYQLLAKEFMHSCNRGITSYDTLFRLCETLSELSNFNLDVTPVDWMRQRLHELMHERL